MKKVLGPPYLKFCGTDVQKETTLVKYLDGTKKMNYALVHGSYWGLKSLRRVGGVWCQQTAKLELIPLSCPSASLQPMLQPF